MALVSELLAPVAEVDVLDMVIRPSKVPQRPGGCAEESERGVKDDVLSAGNVAQINDSAAGPNFVVNVYSATMRDRTPFSIGLGQNRLSNKVRACIRNRYQSNKTSHIAPWVTRSNGRTDQRPLR